MLRVCHCRIHEQNIQNSCDNIKNTRKNADSSCSTNQLNKVPGFTRLKHTQKCGEVVHAAALGSQRSVLLICLFLLLRVAFWEARDQSKLCELQAHVFT